MRELNKTAVLTCCYYQGNLVYPKQIERIFLSNLPIIRPQVGVQVIREQILSHPKWQKRVDDSTIVFFKVEIIWEDEAVPPRIWMFDREGNFLGEHWDRGQRFDGRNSERLRFQKGALVQFITDFDPLLLQLGVILGIPWSKQKALEVNRRLSPAHLDSSDNTYAVFTCSGEEFVHYHLPECYLFEPTGIISNLEREKLFGLLAQSQ